MPYMHNQDGLIPSLTHVLNGLDFILAGGLSDIWVSPLFPPKPRLATSLAMPHGAVCGLV